ncbi:AMP-binding protein [Pseudohalocynthiibacter sp. F2068]|jgi:long-subunit acyl-CoA synthetase (AMP-forming)|uniref:AMP-binding protein n=1 Tax=Pseudohalocynthiibacter sp. F2068 TaxID=2926418 RepID=UPI001FF5C25D|nr:AMP-binding protein [Pseudohalocynthiibacter sp. F2068]MCK0102072.1 AMP-binding protein [Pseudohalocynthiibacter sp. F2068]
MKPVFEALARHVATRPEIVAFRDDAKIVTWADLSTRVVDLASRLAGAPNTVGIALAGGIDYVVADLAVTLSGRTQVPLPFFFSNEQNAHILMDAQISAVIALDASLFSALPHIEVIDPTFSGNEGPSMPEYQGGVERVIYTSGSSGRPKGVVIGDRQLDASLAALSKMSGATATDRHLSILPLAQLLEQICGIFLPILAGAETIFRFDATKALFGAPIKPLTDTFFTELPTTSLLAPSLLGRWVADLELRSETAPDSLRFVAVGGASTAPSLATSARAVGIPLHEGYGLSECCAVVAMNRPGESVVGTVGPVLDGLDVKLENGEITVEGPTVMVGYLNGDPAPARWKTGDLGHFVGNRLVIDGRKDALLVTGAGRNISPEWVEQRINADPRIVSSALGLRDADGFLVLVVATAQSLPVEKIARSLADLPDYAKPTEVIFVDPAEPGLLFPVGTPDRAVAKTLINTRAALPLPNLETIESLAS